MPRSISGAGRPSANDVVAWVPPVARVGYAAKGVVYALVGGIAIKAARDPGGPQGRTEALASLTDESGGQMLLLSIAIGLVGFVVWRLVQAALDPEHRTVDGKRIAVRILYLVSAVVYGSLAYTAWQLGRGQGSRGSSGDGKEVWISRLLEQPFGTWLVMIAGLGVIAYGVYQVIKAVRGDIDRRVQAHGSHAQRWIRIVGRVGTAGRGLVMLPIGWFVFQAGRAYNAQASADTGEVLKMIEHTWLLVAVGVGLLAYGLYQIAKAVYRRFELMT